MKKGFTLIELLAVIVILAIISVIAYASISNVVEKSRRNSAINSAYGYMDALEKQILINQMNDNEDIVDGKYESVETLKNTYKVTVKGSYPQTVSIDILKGKISHADFVIDSYEIECTSSTQCSIKGTSTKIDASEVQVTGIDGVNNVADALDDLREKLN